MNKHWIWAFIVLSLVLQLSLHAPLTAQQRRDPPPVDSLQLIAPGVGFGGSWYSPQYYPHAKHIAHVRVGSYYCPVVIWKEGTSWNFQLVFAYWEDMFQFWSYPDSFTMGDLGFVGGGNICADSKGNLHFAWHESGNPDGYEIFYTRAILDTTSGYIQYSVENPAIMLSSTNGEHETYPSMAMYEDTTIVIAFTVGDTDEKHTIGYNRSNDGGDSWDGANIAYEHGGVMPGLLHPSIASDPTCGNMWVSLSFDDGGTEATDIVALFYDIAGDIWAKEMAAMSPYDPNTGTYTLFKFPVVCVDYSGIPSIAFTVIYGGAWGQQPIWYRDGILLFTRRVGGAWISPVEIGVPESGPTNAISGYPSIGISSNNEIYIASTQPEGALPDTSPLFPFNLYCWRIDPSHGAYAVPRTKVSEISGGDSVLAVFPHITYKVPEDSLDGPGITWCEMRNGYWGYAPPSDVYYKRLHQPIGIGEEGIDGEDESLSFRIYPNPFSAFTAIQLSGMAHSAERMELEIFDVSGRSVREISLLPFSFSLGGKVEWDGRDEVGQRVAPGVYFVKARMRKKLLTRKIIMVE